VEESSLIRPLSETLMAGEEFSPFILATIAQRRRILIACRSFLSEQQSLLLELRYEQDLTYLEIAQQFQTSEAAVWQMHGRIRIILAAELKRRSIVSIEQI
jgi:DNA-directed RNA polymerase specialized sigma subunit